MHRFFAALAAVTLPAALLAQQADPRHARVDSIFAGMDRTSRPGCAVGAVQNGAFLLRKGYGMANLEAGQAITPETVFYMGSVSKQFTALSIALLARDGRLGLGDSARKWIREIPAAGSGITIRHMVHHQSGLREKEPLLQPRNPPRSSQLSFLLLPRGHVRPEIDLQNIQGTETVCPFTTANVPMITFPSLVVVSNDAGTIDDIGEPVFEIVGAPHNGFVQAPNHQLDERPLVQRKSLRQKRFRIHVVNVANKLPCCQDLQRQTYNDARTQRASNRRRR